MISITKQEKKIYTKFSESYQMIWVSRIFRLKENIEMIYDV